MQVENEPESPAEIRTKHSKLKLSIPTAFTFEMFYINHGLTNKKMNTLLYKLMEKSMICVKLG